MKDHCAQSGLTALLCKATTFYLLDYITFSGFSKCGDRKKNKNKNWTEAQIIENFNIGNVICINDLYSMKVVNVSPKDQIMCIYFNFKHFKWLLLYEDNIYRTIFVIPC